ncbi:MAG: hypothetical protein O2871_00590 [bacterium]|nr:hypothetical protein [bacterium]
MGNVVAELENRILKLEERNKRVEMDKDWEISWIRKSLLIIFTYLAIAFYLNVIEVDRPWLNAIVPAVGFLLSTLTLPFFKSMWGKFSSK